MCTLQTGKICYNAVNINYVLRKVVCSLFIPLKVRSAVHVDRISQQSYESYIILRNNCSWLVQKSQPRSVASHPAFGSISLHLISKRIKEILTQKHQMWNIYPTLMIKMLLGNKKNIHIFFQISAVCMGICAYIRATFLVVDLADRFLGQALYGEHFVVDKEPVV